ncbi:MAG: hypothetical protein ABSA23_10410 [Anaerolineales bacterium]|jgi:hypothetical protein
MSIIVGNWGVKVPLDMEKGVSIFGVPVGSTFGVIGTSLTEIIPDAKGSTVEVRMGLPGFVPAWLLINHNNPVNPKTSTTKPSNIGRRTRFSIGIPNNNVFAGLPLISGGNGAISLRVKTGQRVCRRPLRQTKR